jgi:hypothetical protein
MVEKAVGAVHGIAAAVFPDEVTESLKHLNKNRAENMTAKEVMVE